MSKYDFDLFVIGAGSGGVRAARMSAGFGAKTAIAEDRYLGGTCVNVGCVPKKLLVYASHYAEEFENSKGFGWEPGKPAFEWGSLIRNKDREIRRLNGIYEKLLVDAGVELLNGRAVLTDPHTVSINNRTCTAERILVATGGWPVVPEVPGKEHGISSNEAFYLETLPEKIVIIGGGYIAVEFAGIFNGLGVDTTLVYRGSLFLRGFDTEVRELLAREVGKKGITLRTGTAIEAITKTNAGLEVGLKDGSRLQADRVMFATGRKPNTVDLGLENVGVALDDNGAVVIDQHYQTNIPSVYAIGDVTNRYNLTPVATAEGMAFAKTQYGGLPMAVDYDNIPTCIFSQPNLGTVGLTEEQARAGHKNISVFRSEFTAMKHTLSGDKERTFMKLLVNNDNDQVIGAHMIGADAGEIIQGIAIAMKAGATKAQFDATIGIHPTTAEEFVTMRTSS